MRKTFGGRRAVRCLPLVLALALAAPGDVRGDERLPIQPVIQQSPVWCWAAVGEMVLRCFDFPTVNPAGNYQSGIAGSLGGQCSFNCGTCITAIGSAQNLMTVLENYQEVAERFVGRGGERFSVSDQGPLDPDEIVGAIDEGSPIIAGINPSGSGWRYPSGMSEHVSLIVGHREGRDGLTLVVNDPMPYRITPFDPYLRAGGRSNRPGQYLIGYDAFVDLLGYKDTIVVDH